MPYREEVRAELEKAGLDKVQMKLSENRYNSRRKDIVEAWIAEKLREATRQDLEREKLSNLKISQTQRSAKNAAWAAAVAAIIAIIVMVLIAIYD